MLTQKDPAAAMRGHVLELRPAKKATSGGSSDTEAKEPTAMPTGPSPSSAVMTVTPVGKWPRTWRNLAESNEVGVVTKGEGNRGGSAPRSARGRLSRRRTQIGRAEGRERVVQDVSCVGEAVSLKKK